MMAARISSILVVFFLLLAAPSCDFFDSGSNSDGGGVVVDSQPKFPCHAAGIAPNGVVADAVPGSAYAQQIVEIASQIAGVSAPTGGVWSSLSVQNAAYFPVQDRIVYNANFLNYLVQATGLQESGDSVIFHEVGHAWVFKTGRNGCLGAGTTQSNWAHEYQADSFAGTILRLLGGDPRGSIAVYQVVFRQWGHTHPPGSDRATVFWNSWASGSVQEFCSGVVRSARDAGLVAQRVTELRELAEFRDTLIDEGLNPYSSESNEAFLTMTEHLQVRNPR